MPKSAPALGESMFQQWVPTKGRRAPKILFWTCVGYCDYHCNQGLLLSFRTQEPGMLNSLPQQRSLIMKSCTVKMPKVSLLRKSLWPVFFPPFLRQVSSPNPSILGNLPQAPHCISSISLSCTHMVLNYTVSYRRI